MEKKIIECNINGFKMLYTAEINNMDYLEEENLNKKYIHVKCTLSSKKTEETLSYKKVYSLDMIKLDTPDNIETFVCEILYDIDISYYKNRFIEKLTEIIKEYKSKNLNFDKLEKYFDNDDNIHRYYLSNDFTFLEFIPIHANIEFNTKLAIYPYYYNKGYNLHVKLTYSCTKWDDTFEYKIKSVSHLNNKCDYEKVTLDILRLIYHKGYVIPTISTFNTVFDMVKYCFDNYLFNDIDQIENEMTMKEKEENNYGKRTFKI